MSSNPYSAAHSIDPPQIPRSGWGMKLLKIGVLVLIGFVLIGLLLPATRRARPAARRMQCSNHLKQIALAFHNYQLEFGRFPPAYTVDTNGNRLHSWRTLLLPYLEQKTLYEQIELDKPWDDPSNEKARSAMVPQYRCPEAKIPNEHTNYQIIVAPNAFIQPGVGRKLSEVTDKSEDTLLVFESQSSQSIHWMNPKDLPIEEIQYNLTTSKSIHDGGRMAAFVDGHVEFLHQKLPANIIQGMVSIDGGEDVRDSWSNAN